jgi:hypothetical protein
MPKRGKQQEERKRDRSTGAPASGGERQQEEQERQSDIAARAIVLQLLRDDREEWWTPAELGQELSDLDAAVVDGELVRLEMEGVVLRSTDRRMKASARARCLDALGLVAV